MRHTPRTTGPSSTWARSLAEGRAEDADADFRAAVEAGPSSREGYLYLAKALLDGGDLPGAEAAR